MKGAFWVWRKCTLMVISLLANLLLSTLQTPLASYASHCCPWFLFKETLPKLRSKRTDFKAECLENCMKKTVHLFQELNRLRKAALAFGFLDLLKGVADMLERECTLLPDTAHPDAAFQLTHAAQQLKLASTGTSEYAAYDHNITPLHTDFSGSSTERM